MREEKQKHKMVIFIILILFMVFILLSIYIICHPKVENSNHMEDNDVSEVVDDDMEKELTMEEKELLLAQIKDYTTILADSYPIDGLGSLDNQQALLFALDQLGVTGQDFMESDLEKVLEKYFGDNHPYIHEDIQCFLGDGVLYRYDSAKREYFFQDIHGHGGAGIYPAEIYYLDGQKKDEVYTVRVNILYGNYCYGTCGPVTGYYKSAVDSRNGENPVLGGLDDYYEITEEEYQSVKDNLPVTKFTFVKDQNENYGLESVTLE